MKKNKALTLVLAATLLLGAAGGCGKKNEPENEAAEVAEINVQPDTVMNKTDGLNVVQKEGCILSPLTGEWIDESLDNKRPLCIMINNIIDAMPQSGISQADLTYEILVEGGITRYLCVFQDYANGLTKLGPVRSSRHDYVELANMFDGFYGHVGWSELAQNAIESSGCLNLNGLTALSNIMYYRDNTRYAPHNCYTDSDKIVAGIDYNGYDLNHKDDYTNDMFKFNLSDTALGSGMTANKVTTSYSSSRQPWFEYNDSDKRYYRFQYGDKQIDDQTGEQLSYKNVIVMFVQYTDIGSGLQDIDWYKGGDAYYITDGEYEKIKWETKQNKIRYYTEDGEQLKMNPGNTFISVFDEAIPDSVTIE